MDRVAKKSYRFGMKIRRVRYLISCNVHRDAEQTTDDVGNRVMGKETGSMGVVLMSGFPRLPLTRQVVMFKPPEIKQVFGRDTGAKAVKALAGDVGTARQVLREQLLKIVGSVPRVE